MEMMKIGRFSFDYNEIKIFFIVNSEEIITIQGYKIKIANLTLINGEGLQEYHGNSEDAYELQNLLYIARNSNANFTVYLTPTTLDNFTISVRFFTSEATFTPVLVRDYGEKNSGFSYDNSAVSSAEILINKKRVHGMPVSFIKKETLEKLTGMKVTETVKHIRSPRLYVKRLQREGLNTENLFFYNVLNVVKDKYVIRTTVIKND